MYVWYKSKNILTLVTIGYIVGFIVGMYIEYCLWAQVAVLNHKLLYWTVWDRFMQVLYLGRAPRTKETLLDFREKCRVTLHSRVFRGLTSSQRTPGIWGVTVGLYHHDQQSSELVPRRSVPSLVPGYGGEGGETGQRNGRTAEPC